MICLDDIINSAPVKGASERPTGGTHAVVSPTGVNSASWGARSPGPSGR